MTLMRGSLHGLADAIAVSKATLRNIKQNLFGAFIYNVAGVPFAAITYGDGSTENFALDTTSGFNFDFFGIISDLKIASIHLGKDNGVSTTSQNGYFALDNLTIGSDIAINVPLPSSLALMGLGLIILTRRSAR